jgi:ribosomal protein S12 methylthiotransferase
MGRKSTSDGLREIIYTLRSKIPGIILRTTLMTGFPGETEEEFEHLYNFAREMRFDRLGVFAYSREDGTPSAKMKPQIKQSVKNKRRDLLMIQQQEIHKEKQKSLAGKILQVMCDSVTVEEGVYRCEGRTFRDAPETDTVVEFSSDAAVIPGDIVNVEITGYDEYDLVGTMIRN